MPVSAALTWRARSSRRRPRTSMRSTKRRSASRATCARATCSSRSAPATSTASGRWCWSGCAGGRCEHAAGQRAGGGSGNGARSGAEPGVETMDERMIERLRASRRSSADEPLSRHTTFGIGGPADVFVTVRNAAELAAAVIAARESGVPLFVLGSGSNILVGDRGIRGVVIDNQAKGVVGPLALAGEYVLRAESGIAVRDARAQPGEAGIRRHRVGVRHPRHARRRGRLQRRRLRRLPGRRPRARSRCSTPTAPRTELPAADLGLAYRSSAFTRGEFPGRVVLSVEITVRPSDRGSAPAADRRVRRAAARCAAARPQLRQHVQEPARPPGLGADRRAPACAASASATRRSPRSTATSSSTSARRARPTSPRSCARRSAA